MRWLFQQTPAKRVPILVAILAAVDLIAFAVTDRFDTVGAIYLGVVFIGTIELVIALAGRNSQKGHERPESRIHVERVAGEIAKALEIAGHPDRAEWLRVRAETFTTGGDTQRDHARIELQRVCTAGMGGLHDVYYGAANPRVNALIEDLFAATRD